MRRCSFHNALSAIIIVFLCVLYSCSSLTPDRNIRNPNIDYIIGQPEVNTVSYSFFRNDSSFIGIDNRILLSSLILKKKGDQLTAELSYEINIYRENDNLAHRKFDDLLVQKSVDEKLSQSDSQMDYHEFFVDKAGEYRVEVAFTDRNTDKTTYYQKYVSILDFSDENSEVELSDPVLFIKSEEYGVETVKHYNIPAYFDSLSLNYTIMNKSEELIITTTLSKFLSDSSYSRPLPYNNYSQSDLEFKGIDYSKSKNIQTITRRLFETPRPIIFELNFTDLPRGNYRAEVSVELANSREIKNQKVDFGIVGANFPYVRSPFDLAEPLGLLMSEKEHKKLMSIKDPNDLKRAVDTYWLKNINTKQRAKDTILLFYERVEEANKLFSTYKEGWKTDQGMIYILFGRPFLIRRNLDRLQWSYTTNLYDNQSNFFFIRPNTKSIHFGFDNYLVERSQFYYQIYYQQIRAWETGVILFDTL